MPIRFVSGRFLSQGTRALYALEPIEGEERKRGRNAAEIAGRLKTGPAAKFRQAPEGCAQMIWISCHGVTGNCGGVIFQTVENEIALIEDQARPRNFLVI